MTMDTSRPVRTGLLSALLVSAGICGFYWLTMPSIVPSSADAGLQASAASRPAFDLDPHHLLVTPVNRFALRSARTLGFDGPAFYLIQIMNGLAGGAACGLFFALLRRLGLSGGHALAFTLALALTHVTWFHSREAEVGIPANFFLVLSLSLCLPPPALRPASGLARALLLATTVSLMVLCALNAVLLVPVFAAALLATAPKQERWRHLGAYTTAAILIGGGVYLLLPWATGMADPSRWFGWLTYHPARARLAELGHFTSANAIRAASGLVNAFIGETAVMTAGKLFLRGEAAPPPALLDWLRFALGTILAAAVLLTLAARPRSREESRIHLMVSMAVALIALSSVFWLGSDPQFWLPALPFLVAWCAVRLAPPLRRPVGGRGRGFLPAAVAAVLLLVTNARLPVPTHIDPSGGYDWKQSRAFAQVAAPGDLLLANDSWGRFVSVWGDYKVVSLIYSLPPGREQYWGTLLPAIDAALATEHRVFALEVFGGLTARAVGGWDEIEAISGRRRAQWLAEITARYDVQAYKPELFADQLWEIRRAGSAEAPPPASSLRAPGGLSLARPPALD